MAKELDFSEIMDKYKPALATFLRRWLRSPDQIEDVLQETFLGAFVNREKFDHNKSLQPWLFTIAAHKAKDALRKAQRESVIPISALLSSREATVEDALSAFAVNNVRPYDELEKNEIILKVVQTVVAMPENSREILILAYFNKFSYKQMAQILRISIGTVKSRLHTAVACFEKGWGTPVANVVRLLKAVEFLLYEKNTKDKNVKQIVCEIKKNNER